MKNKMLITSLSLIMLLSLTGCKTKETNAEDTYKGPLEFKEEYESLNGQTNSSGKEHRSVSIAEDNPFFYITAEELIEKMDSGETFYVYFGSKLCPWCRSVIEKAIEVAKEKKINKIYYIDIWDEEGNEILRDKYILDSNNEPQQIVSGTDSYSEILTRFNHLLSDYTLEDKEGNKIDIGEKRIYAPSFFFVKNGVAEALVEGTSDKQSDSRGELTEEILTDEEEIFSKFFDEDCGC